MATKGKKWWKQDWNWSAFFHLIWYSCTNKKISLNKIWYSNCSDEFFPTYWHFVSLHLNPNRRLASITHLCNAFSRNQNSYLITHRIGCFLRAVDKYSFYRLTDHRKSIKLTKIQEKISMNRKWTIQNWMVLDSMFSRIFISARSWWNN